MNESLSEIIKVYSTRSHQEYADVMHSHSKDMLIGMFTDLLTVYMNDKNSSALREFITVSIAGYKHIDSKIGYNGYKHTTAGDPISCEAKPHNVSSTDLEDYRKGIRKSIRKLNGGGNFTDYTFERFNRDLSEKVNMLVSGFVDGRLLYLLEFPFADSVFSENLRKQLEKHFPHGREAGRFLRSANFNYVHFIHSEHLKVVYCDMPSINQHKQLIVGVFYKKLVELSENRR